MERLSVRVVAVIVTGMMILTMASCGQGNQTNKEEQTAQVQSSTAEATQKVAEEPVDIRVYGPLWSSTDYEDGVQNDEVAKEIEKRIGVRISIDTKADRDGTRLNAMLASGDLPDLLMANDKKYLEPLINGKNIIELDELIKTHGKDILADNPLKVEFSKEAYSLNTGKLYILPGDDGVNPPQINSFMGLQLRWDYYKELGYPEYKNIWDVLDVLKAMQAKHPTTADGKKVYGVSGWLSDWNLWSYIVLPEVWQGKFSEFPGFVDVDCVTNDATSYISNPEGTLWTGVKFWNRANRMGILDPDSFTQKFDQGMEKYKAGRVLAGWVAFMTDGFNQAMVEQKVEDKGFINMPPPKGTEVYYSGEYKMVGKSWALWGITSKCKYPEKAMDLLNLAMSNEGNVLLYNGLEGRDWKLDNNKPYITDETLKARQSDTQFTMKTGIGKYTGWFTRAGGAIHQKYGTPLDFMSLPETFERQLNPLQKDFCQYYGYKYPAEWLYRDMKDITVHEVIAAALPVPPDNIKRIDDAIQTYLNTNCMKLVMEAKSDAEFEAGRQKIMDGLKKIGLDASEEYWLGEYKKTKAIADKYSEK